ncbi:MAG: site-specific DNA-methyltransferase [Chloroflexota bacterium]|nr:site-specific DNA-methyltransferase [Chloroflexota bacterium]
MPAAAPRNFESRTLYHGDNLPFLRGMNSGTVDLIATDPPFNKSKDFHATPDSLAQGARFEDRWSWDKDVHAEWVDAIQDDWPAAWFAIDNARLVAGDDMGAFLCWLGVRLMEMHRVLADHGSIYLHIDHTAHAYVKTLMDAIFGRKNFQNEMVWYYSGGGASRSRWARKHDTLLFYTKSTKWTFNVDDVRTPHKWVDGQLRADGTERDPKGKLPDDVIELHGVMPWSKERSGYPTQKPLALYERIIKASSNPGDMVLDPFAGCATTPVAAERLGREWVGMDIWDGAHKMVLDRLRDEKLAVPDADSDARIRASSPLAALSTPPRRRCARTRARPPRRPLPSRCRYLSRPARR